LSACFYPRIASLSPHLLPRELRRSWIRAPALHPCPLRRAGEGARGGGPASSSPTRPGLHIPGVARPRAPRRGFLSGGRCRAGARRRARSARSCGGGRPLLHLLLLPCGASAAPGPPTELPSPASASSASPSPAAGNLAPWWGIRRRILALHAPAVPEGREDKPAEIELLAMEARSEAPSPAPLPPEPPPPPPHAGPLRARSCPPPPPCSPICEAASSARVRIEGPRLCSGRRTGPRGWAGDGGGSGPSSRGATRSSGTRPNPTRRRAMVAVVVPSYLRGASSGDPLQLCFSPALPLLRGGWGRRAGCVGPRIPFIPYRALFGARATERDRSVGFAVPRCGEKNGK
jgi:hypothetical protein